MPGDVAFDKPVVLIGMMGAGKTTIGRHLAERLDLEFHDSDREIEKAENATISQIFRENGEAYFRKLEKQKLNALLTGTTSVVSTGGGVILDPENLSLILSKSLSLWLDAPIGLLSARVASGSNRPLLTGQNPDRLLAKKLEERKHLYSQAAIRLDASGSVEAITNSAYQEILQYMVKNRHG